MYVLTATLFLLLAVPPSVRAQQAGSADLSFNVASLGLNRNVSVVSVQGDGKLLVGGSFRGSIVRLNADGTLDTTFNPSVGDSGIRFLVVQSDGRIVVGGGFSAVGGVARAHLARLNTDGSLDTSFNPGTGGDNELFSASLQSDGKIVVTGFFYSFNGSLRHGVVRLNTDGSVDTGFDPGTAFNGNFGCYAAAVQGDGKIIAGGPVIKRLNADGSADSGFPLVGVSTNGSDGMRAIVVQSDGKIVIAGDLTRVGGAARNHVARLNTDGTLDTSFDPDVDATVYSLALQTDGKIVVGGAFTQADGVAHHGIARLNTDGSLDASFGPGAGTDSSVESVALQTDGKIVVGGFFSQVNGVTLNGIARLNTNGGVDATLKADITFGPNGTPSKMVAQSDGKLVVLGGFTQVNGVSRNGLARFNTDGGLDTDFDPGSGANAAIYSLASQPDGKLVLIGQFTAFNGVAANNVVRLNRDGSVDTGFNVGSGPGGRAGFANSIYVNLVAVQPDGKIIVSGNFSSFNGVAINQIARLDTDGSVDTAFQAGSQVQGAFGLSALAIQSDGKIVIGGQAYSSSLYGVVPSLARLNADGSVDAGFNPTTQSSTGSGGYAGNINFISLQNDGKIIITGAFAQVDGAARNCIARLNADGTLDTGFVPPDNSTNNYYGYSATPQVDGKILFYGNFASFEGAARNSIARLNADGTLDSAFDPGANLNAGVTALVLQGDGNIVIAGAFTQFGALVSNHLARLASDGTLDTSFLSGEGVTAVQALLLQPDGKVLVGGSFSAVAGTNINALARLNTDGYLDTSFAPGFASGDTVQALALQPDDGNVLVAAMVADVAGSTKHNVILRADKTSGALDPDFNASTDGVTLALSGLSGNKALVAGTFGLVDGVAHANLARLHADGSLDTGFTGATDATVRALAVQTTDGSLVIVGDFTKVDGIPRSHVARLNADGGLDTAFDPGMGPDGPINSVQVLANGQVLVGGSFASVDGVAVGGVARLNPNGTLDTGFIPAPATQTAARHGAFVRRSVGSATAAPAIISSLGVQGYDGKVVVGGLFDQLGVTTRHNVARLNTDGSVDTNFDPGTGPNAAVNALQLQADGRTLLGGSFSSVDGQGLRGAARLLGDQGVVVTPSAPAITSAAAFSGQVGGSFNYQITAGNAPASFGASGLPSGLSVNFTSGLISGTPTQVGVFTVVLSATNSNGTGTTTLTLTVNSGPVATPVITSARTASSQQGQPFNYQITATNVPTSYTVTGLPAGLSVDRSAGLITGAPMAAGTYNVVLSASNSGGIGKSTLTLIVAPALPEVILVATIPTVTAGSEEIGEFSVSLSTPQDHDVVVNLAIKGTAVNGTDYVMLKATKKIKAGLTSKTIKIKPVGGLGGESKKTVKLILEPGTGYTVGTTGKVKVSILAGQ